VNIILEHLTSAWKTAESYGTTDMAGGDKLAMFKWTGKTVNFAAGIVYDYLK